MASSPLTPRARFQSWWCAVQAVGIALWWIALLVHPPLRENFLVPGSSELTLFAFALPDLVIGVCLGGAVAFGTRTARPWARPALHVVTGALAFGTLYCICVAAAGGPWWGALAMTPSLVVMLLLSIAEERCA